MKFDHHLYLIAEAIDLTAVAISADWHLATMVALLRDAGLDEPDARAFASAAFEFKDRGDYERSLDDAQAARVEDRNVRMGDRGYTPRCTPARAGEHAAAAGALCIDDGTGCCPSCGVALVDCVACGGIGYHHDGCAECEREGGAS